MPESLRAGRARDLRLTAGSVSLDDSVIGSRPLASGGDGGNVLVQAGTVTLKGGSISTATDAHSGGNAGPLMMQVGTLALTDGAQIISSTFGSGQGNLTVVARDTITLVGQSSQGFPSGLFASAEPGSSGNAGVLRVEAGALTLSGGAQLSSSTFGLGRAGDIEVRASTVTVTGGAQIRNSTLEPEQDGKVTVRATETVTLEGTSPDGALASGIRVGPSEQEAGNTGSLGQVTTTLTPDNTLGTAVTQSSALVVVEAPTVTVTGGAQIVGNRVSYDITGGTRLGNGPNLFHSFERFSVGTNDTARFSGPSGIESILSRVTGGQTSVIDGQLQSTMPGANLYLLNPSGVLFGPNATLDVNGSFYVSTADYLRLADGARFSAHLSDTSTLSVALRRPSDL